MKRSVKYFAAFLIVAVVLSSCGGLKKMKKNAGTIKYTATPEVLEMHGDSVAMSITGSFPPKYFSKNVILKVTPVIKYNGGELAYPAISVQGEKIQANNKVINMKEGGSFSHSGKIAYVEGMKVSDFELRLEGSQKDKKLDLGTFKVGNGVNATPALVNFADARPIIGKDQFVRITTETKDAALYFAIEQASVNNKELSKAEIKALKDYLKEVKLNKRKQLKSVGVSAYASPDGAEDLNAGLAEKRSGSAEKYMMDELKKMKFEDAKKSGLISKTSTPEDWEGFKQLMETSDLPDKDLILRVLSMYSDPIVREKEIKNIAAAYTTIADKILPQLRRSKLNVNVELVGYSDTEIDSIFNVNPTSLKVEELLYVGALSTDLTRLQKVYQTCTEVYPTEWRGYNNLGMVYIKMKNLDLAKQALEAAKKLDDKNIIVNNNIGVIVLQQGDIAKAEEFFTSASGAGSEVNYNLGLINIKKGDYANAVSLFADDCSFNTALAKILAGNSDGAVKTVDCAPNKDDAMMYYLKAIAGARTQNTDLLFNNLRAAVSKDAALATKATQDMEFFKYFNDETFKSIAK